MTDKLSQNLATARHSLHRNNPQGSYKPELMHRYFSSLDAMAQYPNALGAMFADQLINNASTESCAPVMAAVAGDLKQYMRLRHQATGQRILPIASGTGSNNIAQDRDVLEYLVANAKEDSIDFWTVRMTAGLNVPFGAELTRSVSASTTPFLYNQAAMQIA